MPKDKCVECGKEFSVAELHHVWMEYDEDYLEEGDEPNEYVGVMCKPCLDAASAMCDMPVVLMNPGEEDIS